MQIKIENQNTTLTAHIYDRKKDIITLFNGKEYKLVEKSFESRSFGWRFLQLLKVIGLVSLGILGVFTPFLSSSYRNLIKRLSKEFKSGQEEIILVTPFVSPEYKTGSKNLVKYFLPRIEEFLKKPYQKYLVQDPKKDIETQPVAIEICARILIGQNPQTHIFPLISADNSILKEEQIKTHIETITNTLINEIENKQDHFEGIFISTIFKDQNGEFHQHLNYQKEHLSGGGYQHGKDEITQNYPRLMKDWNWPSSELLKA